MTSESDTTNKLQYYGQWAFGLLFLLTGLGFFTESVISGIATVMTGLFLIPKIRTSILDKVDFDLPKYAVPVIAIIGIGFAGAFLPSTPSAEFNVVSQDLTLQIDNESENVIVSGTAEVENVGEVSETYTVGIYREGEQMENSSKTIEPGESASFDLSYIVTESGTHSSELRSSTSEDLEFSGNGDGEFSVSESIDVPYTLTESNIKTLLQEETDYELANTAFGNISRIDVNDDVGDTIVIIEHRSDNYRGEKNIAETAVQSSYTASRIIYERFEDVDEVRTVTKANFQDEYGNVDEENAVEIAISADTAEQINWDNMETNLVLDYRDWLNIADGYFVYLPVCQELEIGSCAS